MCQNGTMCRQVMARAINGVVANSYHMKKKGDRILESTGQAQFEPGRMGVNMIVRGDSFRRSRRDLEQSGSSE